MDRIDTDVCVVGAGYAGLTATRQLTQAGVTAVVIEARGRVGGRVWTRQTADGTCGPHPLGGSELANQSWGTIDGAIRSGLWAADEVLAHLRSASDVTEL